MKEINRKKLLITAIFSILMIIVMSVHAGAQTYDYYDLKDSIYRALINMEDALNVEPYNYDERTVSRAYREVLDEYPEIFYVNGFYQYYYYPSTGKLTTLCFVYCSESKDKISSMGETFDKAVNEVLSHVRSDWSDFEKVLYFHDYLTINAKYDYDRMIENKLPTVSFTAYGALVDGAAVCDGYSAAFKLLCERSGVDAEIMRSTGMNHSWNLAKLNGRWYHIDITWDDPVDTDMGAEKPGYTGHSYFLLADSEISKDHDGWSTSKNAGQKYPSRSLISESKNQFFFVNDKWYGIDNEYLYTYDMKNMKYTSGALTRTVSACGENDAVYFANGRNIYRYDTVSGKVDKEFTAEDDIFRIFIKTDTSGLNFTLLSDKYNSQLLLFEDDKLILNPFIDVKYSSWFGAAALYCREKGIVYGISDNTFGPNVRMTRAMVVTILGNIAKINKSDYPGTSFKDVKKGEWYSPYVEWAYQNHITSGYGDNFGWNDNITRQQMYTMLYAFAAYQGRPTGIEDPDALISFADRKAVEPWAKTAMTWAYENKYLSGSDNKIMPGDFTTRAQTVVICYAYLTK